MALLSRDLRNQLARVTLDAREVAERACRAALENLAVHEKEYRGHMSVEQRQLRNRLRARGRALGDQRDQAKGTQEIRHLAEDAAYENWHRLLFTRFLAENNLLHTSAEHGNVPVTLQECEELASELGAKDGFDLACKFAAEILPGVFRSDDPVFEVSLAQRDVVELRGLLDSLPSEVFTADDSLGWTYQFWQAKRKDEVNASGNKIGADELSPVTQLFTEDYMVEFLLHNTLGAWWAGKLGPIEADNEAEAREKAALPTRDGIGIKWTYLRFVQDEKTKTWSPAAGTFEEWPRRAAEIKFLDPCMGSGHFPVFALPIIARLRMEEEGLNAAQAIHATSQDNIHGLELDPRCCQIGAFNLALTAWKLGGYQALSQLQVACCGIAPQAQLKDWVALAGENEKLQRGMEKLYSLFKNAPVLGSLINPRSGGDLLVAEFHELQPLLEKALAQETKDDTTHEMAVTARGLAKAAEILAGQFTLVATNVPYLKNGKQEVELQEYCEHHYGNSKGNLACVFVERCLGFCEAGATFAGVVINEMLFLLGYRKLREHLLGRYGWQFAAKLGAGAFETITGEVVNVSLVAATNSPPNATAKFLAIDAGDAPQPVMKAETLRMADPALLTQKSQLLNPDARITVSEGNKEKLLSAYSDFGKGSVTGDGNHYLRLFWELPAILPGYRVWLNSPSVADSWSGREYVVMWELKGHDLRGEIGHMIRGDRMWGHDGVAVCKMSGMDACLYAGELFDDNIGVLLPEKASELPAIFAFANSPDYRAAIRAIDQAIKVTAATLVKVPFDLAHWQKVAAEKYPNGLPKPFSSDPTQWLFNGHPAGADQPLHVAVARLLGYQWPRQTGSSFPDCPALGSDGLEKLADNDGIVCLPPLNREQPAAARLRNLLAAALGKFDERALLNAAEAKKTTLEDWLRDEFFEQHCALFHHRPFLWHIWDGRKDGFSALVNYHRLNHANLQKLTYTYLGSWINDQEAAAKADTPGAAERLLAAQELQKELAKILEGEPPYDIFVRWKPLAKQARGWNPDVNDGVRLNIRPFLLAKDVGKKGAGILRSKPNIKWDKDRGKEPQRPKNEYPWFWCDSEPGIDPVGGKTFAGHRWNNVHLTLANKSS
jgi:hypothetical protein